MKSTLHLSLLSVLIFSMAGLQQTFGQAAGADEVIITEIMYNPPEAGQDSLEFLELYNPSTNSSVNMGAYYFSDGIEYEFPAGVGIAPQGFLIIAKDSVAFETVFGMEALEWTSMSLLNNGEGITLRNGGGFVVDTVEYNDVSPWPTEANGDGYSLALCDPMSDNNDASSWGLSSNNTGLVINGITIYADPGALSTCMTVGVEDAVAEKGFSVYPNPSNGQLNIDLSGIAVDGTSWLTVYNTMGQEVHSRSLTSATSGVLRLDLAGHAGAYSVVISTADARYVERVLLVE